MLPAAVYPRRVACRLLAAAVVRQRLAAADRPWFQEESFSAPVLEAPAVSAKASAMADRRRAACRLLAAAVVRQRLAVADHLWFREESFSAPVLEALEAPAVSASATADRRLAACRLLAAAVVRQRLAAADRLWFQEESSSALAPEPPVVSAKE